MATRAIWKAVLRFGKESVPVKLYAAAQDRRIRFRLLHEKDRTPVEQRMVDPSTGREVPTEKIRRGFEVRKGVFVVLSEEELQAARPEPSRDIRIGRFVPPGAIHPQLYDRPYWLGPDGDAAAYLALARALGAEGREGLARWTLRDQAYVGALRAEPPWLLLVSLRHASEVVFAEELEPPKGRAPAKGELKLARQLVSALEGHFDPSRWHDEHRERLMELIEAKAQGKTVRLRKPRRKKAPEGSLSDVLEKSLETAKGAA